MPSRSEKLKGLAIALAGHLLYGASQYLAAGDAEAGLLPRGLGIAAAAAMVLGSAYYVRSKGYGQVWGLFGFIPFLGIGTLMLIPPMASLVDEPADTSSNHEGASKRVEAEAEAPK